MKITFLGTGTSQGVPVIACDCNVCLSSDEHDKRLRSAVLVEVDERVILIDCGPDFRQQMLRANVKRLDAILLTHEHKDHVAGLDDVRAFNWVQKKHAEVYAENQVHNSIKREFAYAFHDNPYPGVPKISLNAIDESPFQVEGVGIIPIRGMHMNLPVLGFRIGDFTYLTDMNYIADEELKKVMGSEVLVINGLRKERHISHFKLSESLAIIKKVSPQKGIITHISHQMGLHDVVNEELPENTQLAYDQLVIIIE
ncbi:MBL fold metallo-hydrolase [bacterium]|nr:MBL fold metallo-hydrolase [bacterium]